MMFDLVEQWQQSGKNQKQFSEGHNIKLSTFGYWARKYRQQKAAETGFARIDLTGRSGPVFSARIEVELGDGTILRIF